MAIKPKLKIYTCKVCKAKYEKWSNDGFRQWCSFDCKVAWSLKQVKKNKERERKIKNKAAAQEREKSKSIAVLSEELRKILQWIAREFDKDLPCISTGNYHESYDGGHCFGVKAYPGLQFWMHNIHKQSVRSNQHLGGDGAGYTLGLKNRYGQQYVDDLQDMAIKYQNLHPERWELIEWKKKASQLKKDIKNGVPHNRDSVNKALGIYK